MRCYFYDLGAFNGAESAAMVEIFGSIGVTDYHVYAFEPCAATAAVLRQRFTGQDVTVVQTAIASYNGVTDLYHSFAGNEAGHSIFASKNNVTGQSETVACIRFSDWIKGIIPDFKSAINILKFNIEGAEWHLMRDLTEGELVPFFQVICGDTEDVLKIAELRDKADEHFERIRQHRVHIFQFSGQAGTVPACEQSIMREVLNSVIYTYDHK